MVDVQSQKIVEDDKQALYIGNLNTVEFDLTLPAQGPNGSMITWKSGHEGFLESDGKVHRPPYGMGHRTIELYATFRYGEVSVEKVYQVRILEEDPKIVVEYIYPVELHAKAGETAYLPTAVVIKTNSGDVLSHPVIWDESGSRCWETPGEYTFTGMVDRLGVQVRGKAFVTEEVMVEMKNTQTEVEAFDQGEAVIDSEGSFYQAQEEMMTFLLSQDADQLLYSFREACGLDTKGAPPMDGWDSPDSLLRGHTTGHFLSGLGLCYKATGNQEILRKAIYMIDALEACQKKFEENVPEKPGFLSAYTEEQFDKLEEYVPYPKIWAPYYTLHKIFAGLLECYKSAGIEKALEVAVKLGKWTYARLNRLPHEQRMKMWSMYIAGEFGGMNEVMAELYALTKDETFLQTAKYFDNDKLFIPMEQNISALNKLHVNQHVPQIIGAMKIFETTGEKRYYDIAEHFWDIVTKYHCYVTGGVGEGEMFREPDRIFGTLGKNTAESCASYNMLKLTKELYKYNPKASYMDYYERTLINHILASKDHTTSGESTYFFPLAPGFHRHFEYENSCCHGTGLESHFKYAENVFWHNDEDVYVNLFISSKMCWEEKGLTIHQAVKEETPGMVELEIESAEPMKVYIRKPYWAESYLVRVDGEEITANSENGYIVLEKAIGKSKVEIMFSCKLYLEYANDNEEACALKYGPYVLAALVEGDYMQLPLSDENVNEKIRKAEETLDFYYEDVHFIPVWKLNEETYQVYFKVEK